MIFIKQKRPEARMCLPMRWMAPETLQLFTNEENLPENQPIYGIKSDIWSFGVLLWEIFTFCKTHPYVKWDNETNFRKKLMDGERLTIPSKTPESVYLNILIFQQVTKSFSSAQLMARCWSWKVDERPDFQECFVFIGKEFESADQEKVEQSCFNNKNMVFSFQK